MKNFISNFVNRAKWYAMSAATGLMLIPQKIRCGENEGSGPAVADLDVVAKGVEAAEISVSGLTAIATALFPVSFIIVMFFLFWTHDTRKIGMLAKIAGLTCLATFFIILADAGTVIALIQNLADQFK